MNMNSRNLALLEDILDRDCRNMTQEDMEALLKHEMDKPMQEADMKLMQVLLNILNPSEVPQDDWMVGINQLASTIESAIAMDTFISTGGNPYGFETAYDDIAFLMADQYQQLIDNVKPNRVQLLRDSAKKGEAGQYMIIRAVFEERLDEALLGAAQAAYEYLIVTDECFDQSTGEDQEISRDVSRLHMESINQLMRYAEMEECGNLEQLSAIAEEAGKRYAHIMNRH